jgi:hypothetical protein
LSPTAPVEDLDDPAMREAVNGSQGTDCCLRVAFRGTAELLDCSHVVRHATASSRSHRSLDDGERATGSPRPMQLVPKRVDVAAPELVEIHIDPRRSLAGAPNTHSAIQG